MKGSVALFYLFIFQFLIINLSCNQELTEDIIIGDVDDQFSSLNKKNLTNKPQKQGLIPHGPITINNNTDFNNQAIFNSWQGNGSYSNPYIIENYLIVTNELTGIKISNTFVHFTIQNVVITGTRNPGSAFSLNNVRNGQLINNTADYNTDTGFYLNQCSANILSNNFAFNNGVDGIFLEGNSNNNFLNDNMVLNNNRYGIWIKDGFENTVTNNTFRNNTEHGIYLLNNNNTSLIHNILEYNGKGIFLGNSSNSNIQFNFMRSNLAYGVDIEESSNNNVITKNIFIYNNNAFSQALDNGNANVFSLNYREDWKDPDSDQDGIVDEPYLINGVANNQDNLPLTESTWGYKIVVTKVVNQGTYTIISGNSISSNPNENISIPLGYLGLLTVLVLGLSIGFILQRKNINRLNEKIKHFSDNKNTKKLVSIQKKSIQGPHEDTIHAVENLIQEIKEEDSKENK